MKCNAIQGKSSTISVAADLALFARGEPLRHDVGVGEGAVGHGRQEKHGGRREAVHVELAVQTLNEIVNDACRKTIVFLEMTNTPRPSRVRNGSRYINALELELERVLTRPREKVKWLT